MVFKIPNKLFAEGPLTEGIIKNINFS
jgi:hypothetical protein